jgi:hypothetical protein
VVDDLGEHAVVGGGATEGVEVIESEDGGLFDQDVLARDKGLQSRLKVAVVGRGHADDPDRGSEKGARGVRATEIPKLREFAGAVRQVASHTGPGRRRNAEERYPNRTRVGGKKGDVTMRLEERPVCVVNDHSEPDKAGSEGGGFA